MRRMEDSSAVLNSQKYSKHSNMLTPLSTYLLSWKNPNSIMFAMKSGMYYKVKKPKLIYWKSNMFRFNQTLIWTNILLCASMAQPTIPNGQKVLFRNWSMNGGQPLFSFDYNCTLTTRVEVTENLPFISLVMGQLISLCLTFQSTRWSQGAYKKSLKRTFHVVHREKFLQGGPQK